MCSSVGAVGAFCDTCLKSAITDSMPFMKITNRDLARMNPTVAVCRNTRLQKYQKSHQLQEDTSPIFPFQQVDDLRSLSDLYQRPQSNTLAMLPFNGLSAVRFGILNHGEMIMAPADLPEESLSFLPKRGHLNILSMNCQGVNCTIAISARN